LELECAQGASISANPKRNTHKLSLIYTKPSFVCLSLTLPYIIGSQTNMKSLVISQHKPRDRLEKSVPEMTYFVFRGTKP